MSEDHRHRLFDHLVVLMLENRSFDNLFGYLYEHDEPNRFIPDEDRTFRGVAGRDDLVNDDGGDPPTEYRVRPAPWERLEDMYAPYPNAGEFYTPNINRQVYGTDRVPGDSRELPTDGLMKGFIQDYVRVVEESKKWDGKLEGTPQVLQQVLSCFPAQAMPVLSTLARSFAVSDAWFSSVPSSTWPNRSFAHSGTSCGRVVNKPAKEWALHHDQPTIFERLAGQARHRRRLAGIRRGDAPARWPCRSGCVTAGRSAQDEAAAVHRAPRAPLRRLGQARQGRRVAGEAAGGTGGGGV